MRTVTAAFTAVSEGRFDELGSLLAAEIDWQGLADEDGQIPRCRGRDQALERMRIGLLANSEVSVSAFVEEGDRVIAHVHRVGDGRARARRSGSWSPRSTTGRSPTCAATRPNPKHTTRCTPARRRTPHRTPISARPRDEPHTTSESS